MRQNLRSRLWGRPAEDLLDRPEARVVEPFGERHNIRSRNVFILLRPRTTGQLVRLNGSKDWEVQQGDLVGQLLG